MRLKETRNRANPRFAAGVIPWEKWNPEAVDQALAAGHPVLVSFAADWCVSCQLKRETSIEIKSALHRSKVHAGEARTMRASVGPALLDLDGTPHETLSWCQSPNTFSR
jgi:thiol:disulfide interchange protein